MNILPAAGQRRDVDSVRDSVNTVMGRQSFRLLLQEGDSPVRVEGTPDMVLEVISEGSVKKDTDVLRELYWKTGIPEYWLIDVRGDKISFQILHYRPSGYVPASRRGGWPAR